MIEADFQREYGEDATAALSDPWYSFRKFAARVSAFSHQAVFRHIPMRVSDPAEAERVIWGETKSDLGG